MASGLFALLDDIATIAKLAAASLDDVAAAAGRAGTKAAGVVIDDAAVTPTYVTSFTPDRELPVIWRIAKGSFRNKLLFILPVALLLSAFANWAITPILMIGGAYLCYEGAEKVWEAFHKAATGQEETLQEEVLELTAADHEQKMAAGAIRTDFILSAEIMVIALNEVADKSIYMQAAILTVVAIVITIAVYGVVGLIVKLDDIGLTLSRRTSAFARALGRGLVSAMPKILAVLSVIGTAAMIWVGGGIILHGMEEFGLKSLPHFVHHLADSAGSLVPYISGLVTWLVHAVGAGLFGLVLGAVIVVLHHWVTHKRS